MRADVSDYDKQIEWTVVLATSFTPIEEEM